MTKYERLKKMSIKEAAKEFVKADICLYCELYQQHGFCGLAMSKNPSDKHCIKAATKYFESEDEK